MTISQVVWVVCKRRACLMAPVRVITLTADGRDELYERCVVCGVRRPRDRHLARLFAYSMTHCHRILCPFRFQPARFARGSSASRRNCNFKLDFPEYSSAPGVSPRKTMVVSLNKIKETRIHFVKSSFKLPRMHRIFMEDSTEPVWLLKKNSNAFLFQKIILRLFSMYKIVEVAQNMRQDPRFNKTSCEKRIVHLYFLQQSQTSEFHAFVWNRKLEVRSGPTRCQSLEFHIFFN